MSLKKIDFSNGIRSVEIENNFKDVQRQIDSERITVSGAGISYGLDCSLLENFKVKISKGCLISYTGEEVFTKETILDIDLPILIERVESTLKVDVNNRVHLSEVPYSINRTTTSDNCELRETGIEVNISGMTGEIANIPVASVSENIVTLAVSGGTSMEDTIVTVKYYYTKKRRDIIYIDNEYKIKKLVGTTSSSASVMDLDREDYIYKIGYVEIDGHDLQSDGTSKASLKFIKEYKSVRNVYTDKENNLYLCGTPFDNIKVIHMLEPKNPSENSLWYDDKVNKLKIWRHTDKYQFVDNVIHTSSNPNHPQRFKTVVDYIYGMGQLSVYINNIKLLDYEYEEGSDLEESEKTNKNISKEFRIIRKLTQNDVVTYKIDRYDGYQEWVAVNDSSYVMAKERYIWTPEEIDYIEDVKAGDNQYFFFHARDMRNLMYVPGKNCLEIIIDQQVLNSDQFEEVTLHDAMASDFAYDIRNKLISYYGYDSDMNLSTIHPDYENVGIGFKLNAPLNKGVYMEAVVSQRINSNPLTKRFQRSATFAAENSFTYRSYRKGEDGENKYVPPIFKTEENFRYGESQLEVYLNGKKLAKEVEYREGENEEGNLIGSNMRSFSILPPAKIKDGDVVTYRIETTIYSYDHVEGLLAKFDGVIEDMAQKVDKCKTDVDTIRAEVNEYTDEIRGHIDTIINVEDSLDNRYMKANQIIDRDNLDSSIYTGVKEGLIDVVLGISQINERINVSHLFGDNDFLVINNVTAGNILIRGIDYIVEKDGSSYFLSVLTNTVQIGHQLYVSGIKFNKA